MANMMKMLKEAQEMQGKMQKLQEELAEREVTHATAGDLVSVTATCDGTVKSIRINPKVVDPGDVEMLEDLVLSAVQGAVNKGKETMAEEMGSITRGLNLPGM